MDFQKTILQYWSLYIYIYIHYIYLYIYIYIYILYVCIYKFTIIKFINISYIYI